LKPSRDTELSCGCHAATRVADSPAPLSHRPDPEPECLLSTHRRNEPPSLAHSVATEDVEVLIVGARVAGSVLAALLGQDGWRVLVIDRAAFPSGTLPTHFFRGEGCVGVLRRLGVLEEVLSFGSPRLVREYNADAIDGSSTIDPPQTPGEVGFNLSVRRELLDGVLVERARREPTVEVREATPL
jgi:2-polyprenyl-6-methoxyphenol hydroxylase-like FAD-dependent oxidoreductase